MEERYYPGIYYNFQLSGFGEPVSTCNLSFLFLDDKSGIQCDRLL